MSIKIKTILLLSLVTVLGASCSKNGGENDGKNGTEGNTSVTVTPDRERLLLKNPLSGWVTYSGIGSGLKDNFWELYDSFDCADAPGGKVSVWDYSNVLYIKADWADMNPQDGVYIWEAGNEDMSLFSKNLKYLMDGAKKRGLKIAFTINTNSMDDHDDSTPAFVREEDPNSCYMTQTGSAKVWSGYPDNPTFQKYYAKFIKDFAARFNNPDEVAFISGLGLGGWGECHTFKYSTQNEAPRYEVYDWVTSLYADNFTDVPIVTNYHKMVGRTTGSGSADEMSRELLELAISKGFSMRHDAFGMKEYYGEWEKSFIADFRYQVPVIGEGGWVYASHGDGYKKDGYNNLAELRKGEYDQMADACVNMMDFRYNNIVAESETSIWFNDAYDLVLKFLREGVYRLFPASLSLPESASSGSSVTLQSRWRNLGLAYFPADLKQWHGKYKMAYALLDKTTGKAVNVFVDESAPLQKVTQDVMQTFKTGVDLSGVAPGTYTWGIAIVNKQHLDDNDNPVPEVELSVKKEDMTEDGWLKLIDVTID